MNAPTPPVESKPSPAAAAAPPAPAQQAQAAKAVPTGPASKVALPFLSPAARNVTKPALPGSVAPVNTPSVAAAAAPPVGNATAHASQQYQNATKAATAAVAAAMAKLPPASGAPQNQQQRGPIDNLTQQVNSMRMDGQNRNRRAPSTGSYPQQHRGRGGGGRGRGGRGGGQGIDVPKTDFDFDSANAKFNKEDLVKEAIASGEPAGLDGEAGINGHTEAANGDGAVDNEDVVVPPAQSLYNSSSFFDNISSEARDREDGNVAGSGPGGRRQSGTEQRGQERQRNYDTFGMTSVDGGFRGRVYRGRGRGFRGGGGFRGGRGYGRGRGQMQEAVGQ